MLFNPCQTLPIPANRLPCGSQVGYCTGLAWSCCGNMAKRRLTHDLSKPSAYTAGEVLIGEGVMGPQAGQKRQMIPIKPSRLAFAL